MKSAVLGAAVIGSVLAASAIHGAASANVATIERAAACCASARRIDPPAPPETPRRAETIGLFGDSLSVGLTDDRFQNGPPIQSTIASTGRSLWFVTTVSMNIANGHEAVAQRTALIGQTELIVVALGTNDITGTSDPGVMKSRIDGIVRQIRSANPSASIVWVDLAFPRLVARAALFNQVLDSVASTDPAFSRCRWSDAIAANPQWFAGDGVHHTGTGYGARRDVVVGCIDAVDVND